MFPRQALTGQQWPHPLPLPQVPCSAWVSVSGSCGENLLSLPGQLVEFLKKNETKGPLSCDTILKIFYQTCRAVQHMHRQRPPIIHRDLKVTPRPCPTYAHPLVREAGQAVPRVRPTWEPLHSEWGPEAPPVKPQDLPLCRPPLRCTWAHAGSAHPSPALVGLAPLLSPGFWGATPILPPGEMETHAPLGALGAWSCLCPAWRQRLPFPQGLLSCSGCCGGLNVFLRRCRL